MSTSAPPTSKPQSSSVDETDTPLPPSVTRKLYSYQPVNREIPTPFFKHILSMSFHVPENNRIAQQVGWLLLTVLVRDSFVFVWSCGTLILNTTNMMPQLQGKMMH